MTLAKRETLDAFRQRLREVIAASGLSQSAFAARVGADRSTFSQLLATDGKRLPRAETIAAIARATGTSVDWLLGLSQEGEARTDVLTEAGFDIEADAGSPTDARLVRWHAEAAGYKVRYVPSTLPDLLKTEGVIRYEYRGRAALAPQQRIENAEANLAYSRRPENDTEVCTSVQVLEGFARGEGIWRGLDAPLRRAQLETMIDLVDELYPTFRWFLYDGLERYSIPYTVFGPLRAALYLGDMFLVYTSTRLIQLLTRHFDGLIRAAVVQPTEVPAVLERLHAEV